jgi:surface antigen
VRNISPLATCLVALSFVIATAAPALADRDKKHHSHHHYYERHDHDDDDDDRRKKRRTVIIYQAPVVFAGGPPPWMADYGPRRMQGRYVPPYGIHASRCDRQLIGRELAGQVIGGVGGAVLGSQIGKGDGRIIATAGGTLLGVLIGGAVGRSLDQADYACAGQVLEHAPNNRTIVWRNPETGGAYRLTPTSAYQVQDGYCREYTSVATVAGRSQTIYGTACRQPDGAWQIVQQ